MRFPRRSPHGSSRSSFSGRGFRCSPFTNAAYVPAWSYRDGAPRQWRPRQWDEPECRRDIRLCSDLPAEGNSADPVRVPSQSGMGL
jgi:hypothetical protein